MAISDEIVAAMRTYLAAPHTDSDAALDDSDQQFLVLLKAGEMAALLAPSAAENQVRLALGARIAPYPDMEERGPGSDAPAESIAAGRRD